MKILVTGGAGFIGSNLVEFLLNNNHEVLIIDDLSTGKISNINHLLKKIQFIEEKLEYFDLYKLDDIDDIDAVVHLAAQASVPLSISNFKESSITNLLSSINILDFCDNKNLPLVYASSSAVYGDLSQGDDGETKVDLLSPYAADKYVMELYLGVLYKLRSMSSIGLRFFNVYGPRQDPTSPYSGVIPIFVDKILNQDQINIFGGKQTRDFIYVDDVVQAIYRSINITKSEAVYEQINILTGTTTSIESLVNTISKEIGFDPIKSYQPMALGDPMSSNGTIEKMKSFLELDPVSMTPITKGLKKTINFIKMQQKERA